MNQTEKQNAILDDAINRASLNEVKAAVIAGADVSSRDVFGRTPLMTASWVAAVDIAKFLLDQGASMDARDNDGKTALELAEGLVGQDFGHEKVVQLLRSWRDGKS